MCEEWREVYWSGRVAGEEDSVKRDDGDILE
jgi:hypothetical protein